MKRITLAFALSLAGFSWCEPLFAQQWPSRPVKIIVPFGAGTGLDVIARGFAEQFALQTKAAFTVENREGAGGTIGAMAAARAPADGYTIFFAAHGPFAVAPYMQLAAAYDPVTDFEPIAKVAVIPMVLITGTNSTLRKFDDVVAEARNNPGKLSYASSGIGTPSHLNVEVVKRELGLDIVSVPYKNTGQAMTDLIGGQLPLYMPSFPAALPMLRNGQVRGLAIGSAVRSSVMPDIPTLAELLKRPGLQASVWYGFLAPKGTPPAIVERLHAEIVKAAPKLDEMFKKLGAQTTLVAPPEFRRDLKQDAEQSRALLRSLNVKPE